MRVRVLTWAIAFPLVAAAPVDLLGAYRLGEWSWLGILAIAQLLIVGAALLATGFLPRSLLTVFWPIGALLAWIALGALWWPTPGDALPNALAFLLLGTMVFAAAVAGACNRWGTERSVGAAILVVDVAGLGIAAANFFFLGFGSHSWAVHPRAFALVALVPLAWHLARWSTGRAWALVPAAAWIAAIFVSLSRMAMGAAIVAIVLTLLMQKGMRERRKSGRATILAMLLAIALAAIATVAPFRDRLMDQDRIPIWRSVASTALEAPFAGNGLGSSQLGPVLRYWWTTPPERRPRGQPYANRQYWAPHPHNEYLRVWHDLGLPGITFFLVAVGGWLRVLSKGWRREGEEGTLPGQLQLAGLLMLVMFTIAMFTDNPLVYPFVVAPVGVLIGAGLGAATTVARLEQ